MAGRGGRGGERKAGRVAAILGQKVVGVCSFDEKWIDPEAAAPPRPGRTAAGFAGLRERARPVDFSFELTHSKWMELQMEIEFRVAPQA